jgi:hypothetical protein
VEQQYFPQQLDLSVNAPKTKSQIRLSYKQFDLLDRLNLGYTIPEGFKLITP